MAFDYATKVRENLSSQLNSGSDALLVGISVVDTTPPRHATRTYSVVLDHEWCERILCSGCYLPDAIVIVYALANIYPDAKIVILGLDSTP